MLRKLLSPYHIVPPSMSEELICYGQWRFRKSDALVMWSKGTYDIFDVEEGAEVSLAHALDFYVCADQHKVTSQVGEALRYLRDFSFEATIRSRKGQLKRVQSYGRAIMLNGEPTIYGVIKDVTEPYDAATAAAWSADRDQLTGLRNRRAFNRLFNQISTDNMTDGWLAICDLDNLKPINDLFGHEAGDVALGFAAMNMRTVLPFAEIARIGGDEFAILFRGRSSEDLALGQARLLTNCFDNPCEFGQVNLKVGCSIGLTKLTVGKSLDVAMREADAALYAAKESAKGCARIYTPESCARSFRTSEQIKTLSDALDAGLLHTAFQPIYSIKQDRLLGYEALARAELQDQEIVGPSYFAAGLNDPSLSFQVLAANVSAAKQLFDQIGHNFFVSLNCSAVLLAQDNFCERLLGLLTGSDIPPSVVTLEILENAILSPHNLNVVSNLTRLRQAGCGIALDDFGTGFSSLSHITELPVSIVKIDKSFVHKLTNRRNLAVVTSIKSLCSALDIEVVAEGVETQSELDLVRALGIDRVQGFLVGSPAFLSIIGPELRYDAVA